MTESHSSDKNEEKANGHTISGIDLDAQRLPQNYREALSLKKKITSVPVGKPGRETFFQIRPGEEWQFLTKLYQPKEGTGSGKWYMVAAGLHDEFPGRLWPVCLRLGISTSGEISVWPLKLPDDDQPFGSEWYRSAIRCAEEAETRWIRIEASKSSSSYSIFTPEDEHQPPEWPELSMDEIIRIAFQDNYIDSRDHAEHKRLRGAL